MAEIDAKRIARAIVDGAYGPGDDGGPELYEFMVEDGIVDALTRARDEAIEEAKGVIEKFNSELDMNWAACSQNDILDEAARRVAALKSKG